MTIKDTIKALEEADTKLKSALEAEKKAQDVQRKATGMRDEADKMLRLAQSDKLEAEKILALYNADKSRKEDELKGREKALAARLVDYNRNIKELNETKESFGNDLLNREADIDKKIAYLEKASAEVILKEEKVTLIMDYIAKVLGE
jgi:hypothetical protein